MLVVPSTFRTILPKGQKTPFRKACLVLAGGQGASAFFLYVLRRKKFHSFHYKGIGSEGKLERLF
ncbi:hypothetical protein BBV17_12000 [Cytobacillus oceanisediminis]|uniref:Uncharacterized protein n=1 Tax=Cytobacillus oceanisediminis TaxID=665099 RepID=A0ABX3CXP3_9BACI|nr:hypothetical protein BBV17_12000 [Cytobacillus oceanisediminis]